MLLICAAFVLSGCAKARSVYYNAWEKFGYSKRERLVAEVKKAVTSQEEAKQQFASALEQFKSVVNFQGGDLEKTYNKLKADYDSCQTRATAVNSRIGTVENVANALFTEWQGEVSQIKDDATLQQKSQNLLDQTKVNYTSMVTRMKTAAGTMQPVLTKFNNRVLYIKSNLNAQAIASLRGTETELGADIDNLIKEMQASIKEADEFIAKTESK